MSNEELFYIKRLIFLKASVQIILFHCAEINISPVLAMSEDWLIPDLIPLRILFPIAHLSPSHNNLKIPCFHKKKRKVSFFPGRTMAHAASQLCQDHKVPQISLTNNLPRLPFEPELCSALCGHHHIFFHLQQFCKNWIIIPILYTRNGG